MSRLLRAWPWPKLQRFALVGLIAAGIDIGGMQALIALGAGTLLARAISLPLAMLAAWLMNRRFTFGASSRTRVEEALRYSAIAVLAAATNYLVFAALVTRFPELWPALAAALGIAISMWISFAGFQRFAFDRRSR